MGSVATWSTRIGKRCRASVRSDTKSVALNQLKNVIIPRDAKTGVPSDERRSHPIPPVLPQGPRAQTDILSTRATSSVRRAGPWLWFLRRLPPSPLPIKLPQLLHHQPPPKATCSTSALCDAGAAPVGVSPGEADYQRDGCRIAGARYPLARRIWLCSCHHPRICRKESHRQVRRPSTRERSRRRRHRSWVGGYNRCHTHVGPHRLGGQRWKQQYSSSRAPIATARPMAAPTFIERPGTGSSIALATAGYGSDRTARGVRRLPAPPTRGNRQSLDR